MRKNVIIIVGLVIIVAMGGFVLGKNINNYENQPTPTPIVGNNVENQSILIPTAEKNIGNQSSHAVKSTPTNLSSLKNMFLQKDYQPPLQNSTCLFLSDNGEYYYQPTIIEDCQLLAEQGLYELLNGQIRFTSQRRLNRNNVVLGEYDPIYGENIIECDYVVSSVNEINVYSYDEFIYAITDGGEKTENMNTGVIIDNSKWYPVQFQPAFLEEFKQPDGIYHKIFE